MSVLVAASAGAANGTWDRAWGKNVNGGGAFGICTAAASCLAGTTGGLGGEMSSPGGVATDSSGNVYVADSANHRIQRFDSSGNFVLAWGKNVNGGGGFGVCVATASCLAGTTGGLGGEMWGPGGVATDSSGNVYVADSANHRIQKFDSSGEWELAWGKNVNGGGAFGVCTNAESCLNGTAGGLGGEMNVPTDVATDSSGNVYVADAFNHRILKFDRFGNFQRAWGKNVSVFGVNGFEICTPGTICQAGQTGGLGGEMNVPTGVATDSSGNLYVADRENHRIQRFDSSGNFLRAWGKNVNGGGAFGICTAAASCLAGTTGGLGGEMWGPGGVATDSSGNVYVADSANHRIQRSDSSGNFVLAWGKNVNGGGAFGVCTAAASCLGGAIGGLGGEMNHPGGVATDLGGNLYVADQFNHRIQRFADPVITPPPPPGTGGALPPPGTGGGTAAATTTPITGRRAAALKKCKKKFPKGSIKRKKCLRRARKLPV